MSRLFFVRLQLFVASMVFILPLAQAQTKPLVLPLWPNGAPGFESRKNEPEEAKDYWVKNIHNPSIAVYMPPKEKATGAAVVICPGGGHRLLVYNAEGVEPALYLNSLGVTAIVLKYRLPREENSPYSLDIHLKQDGYRAMRLVRSHAKEWNIDTARLGMMGFSAGGEVVAAVAYQPGQGNTTAPDPIDRLNGKPNFQILIYPGPLGIPDSVKADAPPTFLLAADNDPCCAESVVKLINRYRAAKVPVEAHLYAQGSHGFNMGQRSKLNSLKTWPQRVADWLDDTNILHPGKYKSE
jgi:acetyl esterase/lipase